MSFSWKCPYCNHKMIVNSNNSSVVFQRIENSALDKEKFGIKTEVIGCPNQDCLEYSIIVSLHQGGWEYHNYGGEFFEPQNKIKSWNVKGKRQAKQFPAYIPEVLIEDYEEACLIKDLSPKASATLSRRCIQGIIRGFWKVKGNTLYQEIDSLKDKVEPLLWKSIHAIREIGNIGAHMEKDINVVIEVEPKEAELLIKLIEILFEKTYIKTHEENKLFEEIYQIAEDKKESKKVD